MTRFALIAETSRALAKTRARGAKIERLADCLRRLRPDEVRAAVACLSGEPRQGKIGLGYAAIGEVSVAPTYLALDPSLDGFSSDLPLAILWSTESAPQTKSLRR